MTQQTDTAEEQNRKEPSTGTALILGIGGAGCRIIDAVSRFKNADWIQTAALDTDSDQLDGIHCDRKIAASSDWILKSGTGCGGDIIRGERAVSRERAAIAGLLNQVSLLIVTGGLGGGTATGGMRTVVSVARAAKIPTVFLLNTPFAFESYARRKNSDDCIADILPVTDVLINLPNDLLFSVLSGNIPVEKAFQMATEEMARTVLGFLALLARKSLFGTDFANFMTSLRAKKAACGVGIGIASESDGLDRSTIALKRMLESPFLGGLDRLESSDMAIVSISGGPDLQIGEMKRALEQLSSMLPKSVNLVMGAAIGPCEPGCVQLTALTVKYEHRHDVPTPRKEKKKTAVEQESQPSLFNSPVEVELELRSFSKGVFADSPPTKYKEEDLDIPTFQRRGANIDKGTTGR